MFLAAARSFLMGTATEDAGEMQDHKQQDEDDRDDNPKHRHPASAGGRSAVAPYGAIVAAIGVGRRVSHVPLLYRAWSSELRMAPRQFVCI
jgi:hypothetical protein